MPLLLGSTGVRTLPNVSLGHSLLQMVLALAVIVTCIWGLGKVLTRLRSGTIAPKRRAATDGLSVVSRQTLGKDLSIATVRWGEREVLVGIAGSTITFLDDARPESADQAPPPPPLPLVPPPPRPALGAARVPASLPVQASPRPASFIESLREATLRR